MKKTTKILTTEQSIEIITKELRFKYDEDFIKKYVDYYYYILFKIWDSTLEADEDKNDGKVEISKFLFRNWINVQYKSKKLADIIKYDLISMGLVITDNYYYKTQTQTGSIKTKCIAYRLADSFYNNKTLKIIEIKERKNITKEFNILPQYSKHADSLKSLKINYSEALEFIDSNVLLGNYKIKSKNNKERFLDERISMDWILSIFNIHCKYSFINKGKKSNRLFTNLTNLSAPLRKFCFFNAPISCCITDVVNSQPLLINALMKQQNIVDPDFLRDCENGIFYDQLSELIQADRETTKIRVYVCIMFGKHREDTKLMKAFKILYPIAYDFIKNIKSINDSEITCNDDEEYEINYTGDGNKCFAVMLQNIEASIIMNIAAKLHKKGEHCLTIHDALFYEKHNQKFIEQETIKEFALYGITPKLKTT